MKPYFLFYGMAYAGMGTDTNPPTLELCKDNDAANHAAWELAIDESSTWEGSHGIPYFTDDNDLLEENPDDYAHEDEREDHIDYYVEEATPERVAYNSQNWNIDYQAQLNELLKK